MTTPYLNGDSAMSKVICWPVIPYDVASDVGVMVESLFCTSCFYKGSRGQNASLALSSQNLRL